MDNYVLGQWLSFASQFSFIFPFLSDLPGTCQLVQMHSKAKTEVAVSWKVFCE